MGAEVRAIARQGTSRRLHRSTSRWHLDEMAVLIGGKQFWLWRAVDDEGEVLDLLCTAARAGRPRSSCANCSGSTASRPRRLSPTSSAQWGGQGGTRLIGSPRARPAEEQPGREFASAGATTRAEDAAFQIARVCSTVLGSSRRRPEYIQRSTPSCFPQHAPRPQRGSVAELAGSDCG